MKIGYFINQYPKVSHTFVRREIHALERQGHDVVRFAVRRKYDELQDPADFAEYEKTQAVLDQGLFRLILSAFLFGVKNPLAFIKGLGFALQLGWRSERGLLLHGVYLLEAAWLVEGARGAGVEHIHAHFGTNSAAVVALCRHMNGPPYSFTVHGPEEFDKPEALKLKEKIAKAAFVVAISSYGRSQLYRWANFEDWPRIVEVHCGIDPENFAEPEPLKDAPAHLVCVGRLSGQKGQLLLIEAFADVVKRLPEATLTLVGDGEMRGEVEARIATLGLGDHVDITGWADEARVKGELNRARALVLPSFAEGLPVVIMEALAAARPVLTTYIAGIPELVIDHETGWLFPAGDRNASAAAMISALTAQDNELNEMGQKGRARVLERHDIDVEAQKLAKAIETRSGAIG